MNRAQRMGQIRWCQEDFSGKRDKAKRMQRRSGVCMSSCVCARSEEGALLNEWAGCSGAADTDGYIIQQERFPQEQWKNREGLRLERVEEEWGRSVWFCDPSL